MYKFQIRTNESVLLYCNLLYKLILNFGLPWDGLSVVEKVLEVALLGDSLEKDLPEALRTVSDWSLKQLLKRLTIISIVTIKIKMRRRQMTKLTFLFNFSILLHLKKSEFWPWKNTSILSICNNASGLLLRSSP